MLETFFDRHPGWIAVGGPDHLVYATLLVLVATGLVAGRRFVRAHERRVRRVLVGVVVLQQLTLYGFYATAGWDWGESLPLHLSRISALLGLVWLLTRERRVMDVLFFFGLYAWGSFSYPMLIQPVTNVLGWSFWVNHTVTLLLPAYAWITTGWRPTTRALWWAWGWFLAYLSLALVVNRLTGGNYFYLRDRPFFGDLPLALYLPVAVTATLALFWLGYAVARLVGERTGTWRTGVVA